MVFRCPNIQAHYNEAVIYLNFRTPKIMNFPFGTNGKFIIFRCPNTKAHKGKNSSSDVQLD